MSIKVNKIRKLSDYFIESLQDGILRSFLSLVKQDPTLCLQIRADYINIYYRGGNLVRISQEGRGFIPSFDSNYCKGLAIKLPVSQPLATDQDVNEWIYAVPLLKQAMDYWFGQHSKDEREYQQLVWRENNGSTVGGGTDYFIIDIEYDNHIGARLDMVAVRWDSNGICRKFPERFKPVLTFVEMKYGDGALSGKAGMEKHIEDLKRYISKQGLEGIKKEMLEVFKQQRLCGLIPALKNNLNPISIFADEVDYLFILANHDPDSRKLYDILNNVNKAYGESDLGFKVKFCVSNFMGYGIYKQNVYSLDELMSRFDRQILCKL